MGQEGKRKRKKKRKRDDTKKLETRGHDQKMGGRVGGGGGELEI